MLDCGETDLDFYGRRALEEAQAAANAPSVLAGAAHRHMAAAYTARLREEQEASGWIDALLSELDVTEFETSGGETSPIPGSDSEASPLG